MSLVADIVGVTDDESWLLQRALQRMPEGRLTDAWVRHCAAVLGRAPEACDLDRFYGPAVARAAIRRHGSVWAACRATGAG